MPARQLRSLRLASVLVGFGLVMYAGCSSGGAAVTSVTHPTMIEVSPEDFLGPVPCTDGPGLKRYVATLTDTDYSQGGASSVDPLDDTSDGGAPTPFTLPSSLPTPCLAAVGFGLVVPGRHYDVQIDGYDTDDLAPRASGSREMVSPAPSETTPVTPLATPRWTAHCEDAIAVGSTIVRAHHCTTFTPADAAATGSVRFALGALLGGITCGDEPGQVDHFEVQLDAGEDQPRIETFSCSPDAEAVFEGIAPRQRVTAYVTALGADSDVAFAGASCNAYTLPEASVDAACPKLSEIGTVRADLPGVYKLLELDCSEGSLETARILIVPGDGETRRIRWPDCLHPFDHGFGPGNGSFVITAEKADGSDGATASCSKIVAPGQLVVADCSKNP